MSINVNMTLWDEHKCEYDVVGWQEHDKSRRVVTTMGNDEHETGLDDGQ